MAFTDTYMADIANRIIVHPFLAYSENAEECKKEIEARCDKIELASNEIAVKLNALFQEIQKALCFTYNLEKQLPHNNVTDNSDNNATREKLKLYMKHLLLCENTFKTYNGYAINNM